MTGERADPDDPTPRPIAAEYPSAYPRSFWVGLVVGWVVIALGLRGLVLNADAPMSTAPTSWAFLFAKVIVVHDFVLLPVVYLVGRCVARIVTPAARAAVQGGLICTAIVTLFVYPFVRGFGRRQSNPTILSQNYGRGLLVVLAVIWLVTGIVALVNARRHPGGATVAGSSHAEPTERD